MASIALGTGIAACPCSISVCFLLSFLDSGYAGCEVVHPGVSVCVFPMTSGLECLSRALIGHLYIFGEISLQL